MPLRTSPYGKSADVSIENHGCSQEVCSGVLTDQVGMQTFEPPYTATKEYVLVCKTVMLSCQLRTPVQQLDQRVIHCRGQEMSLSQENRRADYFVALGGAENARLRGKIGKCENGLVVESRSSLNSRHNSTEQRITDAGV